MSDGISLMTALNIQGNEMQVSTYRDGKSQKWGFAIGYKERPDHPPVVTSSAAYYSRGAAKNGGVKFVEAVKRMDLSPHRRELEGMLGEAKEVIQEVISAASR